MTDRSSWWDEVDADLAAAGAEDTRALPDPWATAEPDAPALTADQQAFLAGLDDQPGVPRLQGLGAPVAEAGCDPALADPGPGTPTGSPPGDSAPDGS
jgi:hypothetical protein